MEKLKCRKCNHDFEGNGYSSICANCRRRNGTRTYLIVAITILIVGFIGGIIMGNEFAVETGYLIKEKEFNGEVMLYCWISTLLFDLFIFAIYSVCRRLDILIDKK